LATDNLKIISRKDATELGLKRFFTGKSCRHGHLSERYVNGLGRCIACVNIAVARWNKENPEGRKVIANRSAKKNYKTDERREWRKKNRASLRESLKTWRMNNPEKAKNVPSQSPSRQRERRLADPHIREKQRNASRLWRLKNPERNKSHHGKRRAKQRNAGGSYTADDLNWILKAQKGKCAYCRIKVGKKYHVDHIIPIAKGGSNNRSNIQITCVTCNLRKQAKDPIDFARLNGMLV
jgi:5-methylcytosine-specific restriction endonuclease McrA